ncbi:MAG: MBL fold metallo-hydrolase [Pedobacter sp.]|nr:MAG: MBL fold metallo-hydrolase [Pedobacter sp.]
MKIEQIYTGCLAEAAYYIESNGEAAIIDPLREINPYLKKAAQNGATIKYIFETHFHADFVSGHVDLAEKSGATIVYGPTAKTDFPSHIAKDGEQFKIGDLTITTLHTPGHTLESTTYLLTDANGKDYCIFTGDTLFIGDVGRPDLAQKGDLTMDDLAGLLYDSLDTKIKPLADDLIVYPAHGAGSACGKSMSKETFDTLGHQKEVNYALKATTKEQFIKEVTDGILPPPQYFAKNVALNKGGYESIDEVFEKGLVSLAPREFESVANLTGALVLDTRDPQVFAKGFIPNSINIGLNGQFAPWALNANENIYALDVRKPGEYESEHLEATLTRPLDYINDWTGEINPDETYYIHCAGGYRSMIAASILKARGIENVIDVAGGYAALKETNLKRTDFACPSKAMKG